MQYKGSGVLFIKWVKKNELIRRWKETFFEKHEKIRYTEEEKRKIRGYYLDDQELIESKIEFDF